MSFCQETERKIMSSKVKFFRRSNFDLLITAFFMKVPNCIILMIEVESTKIVAD
jgi:hypothetical protein